MSISFKKIKAKWAGSPLIKQQKIALSSTKCAKVHAGVLLTVLILSVVYLVHVNALATRGYAMKELDSHIADLKKENERLQMDIIEAQSMSTLQKKIDEMKLVRADRIDYLEPGASVALVR